MYNMAVQHEAGCSRGNNSTVRAGGRGGGGGGGGGGGEEGGSDGGRGDEGTDVHRSSGDSSRASAASAPQAPKPSALPPHAFLPCQGLAWRTRWGTLFPHQVTPFTSAALLPAWLPGTRKAA